MDSLATLDVPAIGYGIRYEFGIFDQAIRDGWQVELTDKWLRFGNPWEIVRSEITLRREASAAAPNAYRDERGRHRVRWLPDRMVKGVAYDTPVPGLSRADDEPAAALEGGSHGVVRLRGVQRRRLLRRRRRRRSRRKPSPRCSIRTTSPRPASSCGWRSSSFFVSCSLQDMIRLHLMRGKRLDEFDSYWAAQLNDTHPSIAVAELMRLLVDEHLMDWDQAWQITQRTCALHEPHAAAEALEKWPLPLFGALLPRHLEIIYEINRRFLDDVRPRHPGDDRAASAPVAHRRNGRAIRAHGAPGLRRQPCRSTASRRSTPSCSSRPCCATSTRVAPEKFFNVTNGVTPRRWMVLSNPRLSALITGTSATGGSPTWRTSSGGSSRSPATRGFQQEWHGVKADEQAGARRA